MRFQKFLRAFPVLFGILLIATESRAEIYEKLVDDVFPSSPPRLEFPANEFQVMGTEALPPGTRATLEMGSVQWSRIEDRLVIPRAKVHLEIPGVDGASVSVLGRTAPFRGDEKGVQSGDILVPLVSGKASEFSVTWKSGTREATKILRLEKKTDENDRIVPDSSCSSSYLQVRRHPTAKAINPGAWTFFDCRWIRENSGPKNVPILDLAVFWNGQDDSLKVNGVAVRATEPSIFRLRLRAQEQPVRIETKDGQIYDLSYRLPPEMKLGFIGMGIGPYQYKLHGAGASVSTATALLTLYGSYQLGESVRLTAFNATTIHRNYFTDTGFYVKTDSFRFFDQRIQVYLMLGTDFFGFKFPEGAKFKSGFPQGFEAVMRDVIHPNWSATAGAFIYPQIDGKSYYNVWLRYGSPNFFGEVNYIAIRDSFDNIPINSRSAGISFGFPLARLF